MSNIRVGQHHCKHGRRFASIAEIGLLHPIVVCPDGTLIAGERRLKACEQLGWIDVPVTVTDIEEIARGSHDENIHRKNFLWSEAVAIKRAIEPAERRGQGTARPPRRSFCP